jgi:hypothetical protein
MLLTATNITLRCLFAAVPMQLFTRRAAAMLYGNQRLQRWCFDVELILLADTLGVPTTEVGVWQA